ncbi:hypothetical protein D3C74_222360 [compost metagenome]
MGRENVPRAVRGAGGAHSGSAGGCLRRQQADVCGAERQSESSGVCTAGARGEAGAGGRHSGRPFGGAVDRGARRMESGRRLCAARPGLSGGADRVYARGQRGVGAAHTDPPAGAGGSLAQRRSSSAANGACA